MSNLETQYLQAENLKARPEQYQHALMAIINSDAAYTDDNQKARELCFYDLADSFIETNQPQNIKKLVESTMNVISKMSGAKSAKILKTMVQKLSTVKGSTDLEVDLCELVVDWCKKEGRTHLQQKQSIRLSQLYLNQKRYKLAIDLIEELLVGIKKNDDKHFLVEGQLIQSKIYFALENYSKAKSTLTSARATSNQIYCEPELQADLDLQSGIIFAQEKDFKTAYSYFFEAFESLHSLKHELALHILKYMVLCKVMTKQHDDVNQILTGKYGTHYMGVDLDAVKAIATADKKKSIIRFQEVLKNYPNQIQNDTTIKGITNTLYEQLLEQNLFSIIKPYSRVQIDHIAKQINIDSSIIQKKLSELILDKKVEGTLDQGNGCLILFDDIKCDDLYGNALDLMKGMNLVVEKLFEKAKKIKQ